MVNARYGGTARLFHGRLPPEITDRIARFNHSSRVAQNSARRERSAGQRIESGFSRWVNRARGRIAVRDRAVIARIRLTRRQLRNRGIIGAPGFNAYPARNR